MNENLRAENPDAGKPSCHAWPRIPLNAIDDYRCGLERGHDGDHHAAAGQPSHPLYLPADIKPVPYRGAA